MFHISLTHIGFLHQQFSQIRTCLKNINDHNFKAANEYFQIETSLKYTLVEIVIRQSNVIYLD